MIAKDEYSSSVNDKNYIRLPSAVKIVKHLPLSIIVLVSVHQGPII